MPHVLKKKKVVHSEYSGCFRWLTNDRAIIKMQTDAFGLLIHHKNLLHSGPFTERCKRRSVLHLLTFKRRTGEKWLFSACSFGLLAWWDHQDT